MQCGVVRIHILATEEVVRTACLNEAEWVWHRGDGKKLGACAKCVGSVWFFQRGRPITRVPQSALHRHDTLRFEVETV